jgi:putative protease
VKKQVADKKIGKVTHYYNHLGVGIVRLTAAVAVGNTVKIVGHGRDYTQTVSSLQLEHQSINKAKKGQEVGLKVDQKVKEGDEVFLVV